MIAERAELDSGQKRPQVHRRLVAFDGDDLIARSGNGSKRCHDVAGGDGRARRFGRAAGQAHDRAQDQRGSRRRRGRALAGHRERRRPDAPFAQRRRTPALLVAVVFRGPRRDGQGVHQVACADRGGRDDAQGRHVDREHAARERSPRSSSVTGSSGCRSCAGARSSAS